MKSVDNFKVLRFWKRSENKTASIIQYNGGYNVRIVHDINETEWKSQDKQYSELTNAIKDLLNDGFFMENVFSTAYKYPEENRF